MEEQTQSTSNIDDIKKMQHAIADNSKEFQKLGLGKLRGSTKTILAEISRLKETISREGVAQCECCGQVSSTIDNLPVCLNGEGVTTTEEEVKRLQDNAEEGTTCKACGSEVKYEIKHLDASKALSLLFILQFYRKAEEAEVGKYYTKEQFFAGYLEDEDHKEIISEYEDLVYWDLLCKMPTHPEKIIYKEGYHGITDNGIKFAQREIGVPKRVFLYQGEVSGYPTGKDGFVYMDQLLEQVGLNYDELIKVEND